MACPTCYFALGNPHQDHFCDQCRRGKEDEMDKESPCYVCFHGTTEEDCRWGKK